MTNKSLKKDCDQRQELLKKSLKKSLKKDYFALEYQTK